MLAAMNTAINGLGEKVSGLTKKIDTDLEPRLDTHTDKFAELRGGLKFGKVIWIAIGGATGAAGFLGFLIAKAFNL